MAGIQLVAEQLTTSLIVPGIIQQLHFSQNQAKLQINNTFIPTGINHAFIKEEYRNANLSGFRWVHETSDTDTSGGFGLFRFVADDQTGTEIFSVNNLGNLIFNAPVFIDNLSVSGDIDMDNFGIVSLRDPVAAQDAATKAYVDSVAGQISNPYSLGNNLTFNWSYSAPSNPSEYEFVNNFTDSQQDKIYRNRVLVGGRGWSIDHTIVGNSDLNGIYEIKFQGTSIPTLIPFRIEAFPFASTTIYFDGDLFLNNNKISNLADPTNSQDAATRAFVLSSISAGTVTLNGAVSGSGNVGTTITTTFNLTLDQIPVPVASVDFNNQSLTNVLGITVGIGKINFAGGGTITAATSSPHDITFTTFDTPSRYRFFHGSATTPACDIYSTSVICAPRIDPVSNDFMRFVLWSDRSDFYTQQASSYGLGFGTLSSLNVLINQIGNTSASFLWRTGDASTSGSPFSTTSIELMRLTGTGFLGIGTSTPNAPLQFVNAVNNRIITLNETANNQHQFLGFGVNTNILRYQVDATTTDHVFYAGISSSASNEVFRIKGTGVYKGKRSSGCMYWQNNGTTTTMTANTFAKCNGTTTSVSLVEFTMPANNRLTYTGTETIDAFVHGSIAGSLPSFGAAIGYVIFKNGVEVTPSRMYFTTSGANYLQCVSVNTKLSLSTNDYIELYVSSSTGAAVTTSWMSLIVSET